MRSTEKHSKQTEKLNFKLGGWQIRYTHEVVGNGNRLMLVETIIFKKRQTKIRVVVDGEGHPVVEVNDGPKESFLCDAVMGDIKEFDARLKSLTGLSYHEIDTQIWQLEKPQFGNLKKHDG